MLTRIDNDADHFATLQAVDEEIGCVFPKLLALLAALAPEDEDFEIIIRKVLLPDSYRANPAMLSKNAYARLDPDPFQGHAAYSLNNTHVGVKFTREPKKPRRQLDLSGKKLTVTNLILNWLDSDKESPLDIPIENVPLSTLQRPEQCVYHIKRISEQKIKITKFKHFIRVQVKA